MSVSFLIPVQAELEKEEALESTMAKAQTEKELEEARRKELEAQEQTADDAYLHQRLVEQQLQQVSLGNPKGPTYLASSSQSPLRSTHDMFFMESTIE